MKISTHTCITIPIKFPDFRLGQCLSAIDRQCYDEDICVLLISSGHQNDHLLHIIGAYGGSLRIVVRNIPSDTFQHGRTRNMSISFVDAQYYVFLTQDAVPANEFWLDALVKPLKDDSNIAGSYSRHSAHLDHSIFTCAELNTFFLELGNFPLADKDMIEQARNQKEKDLMQFFSNNSSCIRGSFMRSGLTFPEVDFAEDQAWSANVIRSGYKKAFSFDSVIRHSHELGIRESFGRGFDEARSFRTNQNRRIMKANPISVVSCSLALISRDFKAVYPDIVRLFIGSPLVIIRQLAKRFSQSFGMYAGSSQSLSRMMHACSRDVRLKNTQY